MARKKTDPTDKLIERAYYRHAQGVQISVMNIPSVFKDARAAIAAGTDLDAVMVAIVAKYREN